MGSGRHAHEVLPTWWRTIQQYVPRLEMRRIPDADGSACANLCLPSVGGSNYTRLPARSRNRLAPLTAPSAKKEFHPLPAVLLPAGYADFRIVAMHPTAMRRPPRLDNGSPT